MVRTMILFEERKQEIEFYYSILQDINSSSGQIQTIDNARFERILKSNFLLMLYNFIEACITTGFIELYEAIETHNHTYQQLIEKIQRIWSDNRVNVASENSANQATYKKVVHNILDDIMSGSFVEFNITERSVFTKNILKNSGSLDARAIRNLFERHNMDVSDKTEKHKIKVVKDKRNSLAHGEESFGDCARDITIMDLEEYKDEVISFIDTVLCILNTYYTNKAYLIGEPSIPS